MIILAPAPGPMIAGFALRKVNTPEGGKRWQVTGFASETRRDTPAKSNGCPKIKRRAARCGNTETALTRPASLRSKPTRREGQAVQKPRASLYAHPVIHADTNAGCSVAISTVLVVDRGRP